MAGTYPLTWNKDENKLYETGVKNVVLYLKDKVVALQKESTAVDALEKNGAIVDGMVAIFSYHFIKSIRAFEEANVTLYTLSQYETLLDLAVEKNYIDGAMLNLLKEWRINPELWGK